MVATRQQLHQPTQSEIRTSDRLVVEEFLSTAYNTAVRVDFETDDQPADDARYAHSRTAVGLFASENIDQRGTIHTSAESLEPAVIFLPRRGRVECHTEVGSAVAGPGEMLLTQSTNGLLHTRMVDVHSTSLVLAQSLLVEAATANTLSAIRFTGHRPINAATARTLRHAAQFVTETILADPERATPLVLGGAARLLASAALAAFPNTEIQAEGPPDSRDVSPESLRRAIDFIEANAHNDIGIADIAATVYLTPRAVQLMFRRYLDMTPTEHLRRVRLKRARADLIVADRAVTTVAATAAHWGFAHTGRFAVLYRQTFGESPHVTLRS
ncbi:MAG: helix-turn-helix transcriptional regulator [Mycobacterium sp.]